MAERRMFAKTIIDSDAFLDMPLSAQSLYFHLSMRADDEGFINNPKKIQRMIGASDDDLKLLIAKNFIIPFESGIVVIKHWKIHNYIQNDRFKATVYQDEKALLQVKDNKAYTLCIHDGYSSETQVRLGKDRLGKDSIVSPLPPFEEPELSEPLRTKLQEWLQYKKERRDKYTDTGMKSLLSQVKNAEKKYGTYAVVEAIDYAMSNGWKGMNLDRLKTQKPAMQSGGFSPTEYLQRVARGEA